MQGESPKTSMPKRLFQAFKLAVESYFLLCIIKISLMTTVKLETVSLKLQGSVSTPHCSPPNPFTWPGVAVNTWQTPKSQRCRKLRFFHGEHVIHLFSHTCLSFGSFVSLTLCVFALCHFQCQHKLLFLYYSNKVWHCGLVRFDRRGIWLISSHGAPQ